MTKRLNIRLRMKFASSNLIPVTYCSHRACFKEGRNESMNQDESNLDCRQRHYKIYLKISYHLSAIKNNNPEFPNFAETSLPTNMSVDWDGTRYYLNNFASTVQKSSVHSNSYFIRSRSKVGSVHVIKCYGRQV